MNLIDHSVYASRVRGCLLGGAVGDALGNPVEFRTTAEILSAFPDGVRDFAKPVGEITDDTQMTLFTVEGMIRANVRTERGLGFTLGVIDHAYHRWLDTQTLAGPSGEHDGWLQAQRWLYARRAPGNTCLSALAAMRGQGYGNAASNNSKGCGGVMRSAPFGLVPLHLVDNGDGDWPFEAAATCAGYTHGHITGQLASGALAAIVQHIIAGAGLEDALDATARILATRDGHEETLEALESARIAARSGGPSVSTLEGLGGGWIAEEALAIAVYSALAFPDAEEFLDALSLSVSHSGDSDSTGAICGNILGALHGQPAVPANLAVRLEGRGTMLAIAEDFIAEFTSDRDEDRGIYWGDRYPGW
ncbi:ADP-ribosylglycohydrolase family protein [Hoyosella sp. G463]|uniref:ADP-ribosylglycohydrolase family protein n=2 Tax=Lolliginicoccus lacisalsi TaxID=2742202 RepID=A0A927PLE5_9ACTN|nr:ADP-ribosylglycohydrolase family protein [Lolliginicoccus lacisalsi]